MKKLLVILGLIGAMAVSANAFTNYVTTCDTNDTVTADLCNYNFGMMRSTRATTGSNGTQLSLIGTDPRNNMSQQIGLNVQFLATGDNVSTIRGVYSSPLSSAVDGTTHSNLIGVEGAPLADGTHTVTTEVGLRSMPQGSAGATVSTVVGVDAMAPLFQGGSTYTNLAAIITRLGAGNSFFNYVSPITNGQQGVLNIQPSATHADKNGILFEGTNNEIAGYAAAFNTMNYTASGSQDNQAQPQFGFYDAPSVSNPIGYVFDYTSFYSYPHLTGAGTVDSVYGFRTGGDIVGKPYTHYWGIKLDKPVGPQSDWHKNYGFTSNFFQHGIGTNTPTHLLEVARPSTIYDQADTMLISGLSSTPDTFVADLHLTGGSQQPSGSTTQVVGLLSEPNIAAVGTIDEVVGVDSHPVLDDTNTATITNSVGGRFAAWSDTGDVTTITNAYGLWVDQPGSITATNTYGLVTDPNAGNSGFKTLTPAATLVVGEGHLEHTGTVPTVSSCGTNPAIVGTDNAFRVIAGSGTVTSCTVTFATAWNNAPICIAQNQDSGTAIVRVNSSGTSAITFIGNDFHGNAIAVLCSSWE